MIDTAFSLPPVQKPVESTTRLSRSINARGACLIAGPRICIRKRSHLPDGLLIMITLPTKWATELASKSETGMGYQVVSVTLKDGKRFDQVVVVEGRVTEIRGRKDIPFTADEIAQVILTHDKWNFNAEH